MNERIKELAEQARQIGEYVNYGQIRLSPGQFEQKFAELIVRECAELCLKYAEYENPFQQMEFRKGHHFNTIIKNHFGVKE